MKEQEIAELLKNGATPADLVHQGYARGTVYKVNKQLSGEGGTPSNGAMVETKVGDSLDDDPEIRELKIALRKAQLEKELEEITGRIGSKNQMHALEERLNGLEDEVHGSLLAGIPEEFECWRCESQGTVAITVHCTACNTAGELRSDPGDRG